MQRRRETAGNGLPSPKKADAIEEEANNRQEQQLAAGFDLPTKSVHNIVDSRKITDKGDKGVRAHRESPGAREVPLVLAHTGNWHVDPIGIWQVFVFCFCCGPGVCERI